jgi:hypothetical protein
MKCLVCGEKATWVRSTQFAGDHPFCDLHAKDESDFGKDDSYVFWHPVEEDKMKMYMVETVSIFRHRYVVMAKDPEHACDEVVMNTSGNFGDMLQEFSQKHIDESITSVRKIKEKEYLRLFDEDNDYLKTWDDEQKKQFINTINYKKDEIL